MFGAFEDPVTWCRDSGIRWLSDPSDLNLALRELPKAHAQKKERGVIDRASLETRILLIVQ
jgi:hypothetical protein